MASDKSQTVLDFFNAHYSGSVSAFVKAKGWKEDPQMIERVLNGNPTSDDITYLENQLSALSHKRDSRSAKQYGEELIRGWLIEDILADKLNDGGVSVSMSGEDKHREFLEETTADADLVATVNGTDTHIEVITDYSGFWQRNGDADLRDNKYNQIQNHPQTLILGLDFENDSVFVVNPEEMNPEYLSSHPYWNKPAYRFDASNLEFTPVEKVGNAVQNSL